MASIHDFTLNTITGEPRSLSAYAGKAVLIVNVASKCGLTPQYAALQALHDRLGGEDFAVLGVPCNQFGKQEPGSDEEIQSFCTTNFGVTFDMFSKVDVNGDGRHPLYAYLTGQDTAPDGAGDISWNFAKFVVDKQGCVTARFDPSVKPDDEALGAALLAAMK